MKHGSQKAEMFAVFSFVEKYKAYLGGAPFKLRVDNRALAWLKTYSMDQSYISRWIVCLDGYHIFMYVFSYMCMYMCMCVCMCVCTYDFVVVVII